MDHELWWDFMVLKLLKQNADDHEVLDVVRSNDEAGRWYFLHPLLMRVTSDRTSFAIGSLITYIQIFAAAILREHGTLEREATKPGGTGNVLSRC